MENNLPESWELVKLVEQINFLPTGVKEYSGIRKYYSTGSIQENVNTPEGEFTFKNRPSRANRISVKGDVFQARMKATDKGILVDDKLHDQLFSTGFIQLRPYGNTYDNKLLYYLIKSEQFLTQKNEYATGSTQEALTDTGASEIEIPLPPLAEQQRIVAKLDALFEKMGSTINRFEKIKNVTFLRKEFFKLAFYGNLSENWRKRNPKESSRELIDNLLSLKDKKGNSAPNYFMPENGLPKIPASWTWASFGQIGKIVTGKTPSKKNSKFWNGHIPFVMPGDLNKSEDCLSLTEILITDEMVTEEGFHSVNSISEEAILVCCIGTLGRVAYTKKPISFSQQLNAIIPHSKIDLEFVGYYCYLIKELLEELWPRETYMPIVNKTKFSTIPIPIPPYEEQLFIVKELKKKINSQEKLEARYNKVKNMLDKLPQSILAKAFRGELVSQNPDDEPAIELLERIKTEKEKLKPVKTTRKKK